MQMDTLSARKLVFNLRELLTNIVGYAELMTDPCFDLPEKRRLEYAEIVYASGLRLTECVERLSQQIDLTANE